MQGGVLVKDGITIPEHELEITASRSGGAGGQHVNRTDTRITVRWNVQQTKALDDVEKDRVLRSLQGRLTVDGDLVIHNSQTRSQVQNKENALASLAAIVRKALFVSKLRMATRITRAAKEVRLRAKARRSEIKRMRGKKHQED